MWTSRTRKQYARDQLTYASNLTAEEWAILEPLLPVPAPLAPVRGFARNSGSLPLRSLSHAARAPSCAIIVTC
jgi:hypothetical protein